MKKEFEYLAFTVVLNDNAPQVIQDELNLRGREGYIVVGTSHWGGYQSTKKVMYTLMRPRQPEPSEPVADAPEFVTAKSKVNDIMEAEESETLSFAELLEQAEKRFVMPSPTRPKHTEPEF